MGAVYLKNSGSGWERQHPKSKAFSADLGFQEPALHPVMCTEFPQKNGQRTCHGGQIQGWTIFRRMASAQKKSCGQQALHLLTRSFCCIREVVRKLPCEVNSYGSRSEGEREIAVVLSSDHFTGSVAEQAQYDDRAGTRDIFRDGFNADEAKAAVCRNHGGE